MIGDEPPVAEADELSLAAMSDASLNAVRYVRFVDLLFAAGQWRRACQTSEWLIGPLIQHSFLSQAEAMCRTALASAHRSHDQRLLAGAQHNLGRILQESGRKHEAIAHHEQAAHLFDQVNNPLWAGIEYWCIAEARRDECRWSDARTSYVQANAALARLAGTDQDRLRIRWQTILIRGIADVYRDRWRYPQAHRLYQNVMTRFTTLGEDGWVAWTQRASAGTYRRLGEPDKARAALRAAAAFFRSIDDPRALTWVKHERAVLDRDAGHLQAALDMLKSCADAFDDMGMTFQRADSIRAAGVTLRLMGRLPEAEGAFNTARDAFEAAGNVRWRARAVAGLGHTAAACGDLTRAQRLWHTSLDSLNDLDVPEKDRLHRWIADPTGWAATGDHDRGG